MSQVNIAHGKQGSRTNPHFQPVAGESLGAFVEQNLFKILMVVGLSILVYNDQLAFSLSFGEKSELSEPTKNAGKKARPTKAAVFADLSAEKNETAKKTGVRLPDSAPASAFAVAIDTSFAARKGLSKKQAAEKVAACESYVQKYAPVAVAEMRKFGIPASVTLAQGLLESDAGQSKLARSTNNHFGIKCFSRRCSKGHCQNFTDDTHKDFFRKFGSVWASYRTHSEFLRGSDRYDRLFRLAADDSEGWARGLQKAGYATDKRYADKLLALIEALDLSRFDRN